jgi:hypothetical protein
VLDEHVGAAAAAVGRTVNVTSREACGAAPAAQPGLQHDPRAGRHGPARRLRDDDGNIAPADVWQRDPHALETAALPEVEVVEGARAHAHQRLALASHRVGHVLDAEDAGVAVLVEPDGPHTVLTPAARP